VAGKQRINQAIFLSAVVMQALQQYKKEGTPVLPRGYRYIAALGGRGHPYLGFIIQSSTKVIVAFRGTENMQDVLSDLDWRQVKYPYVPAGGQTHRGFTDLYTRAVRVMLLKHLRKLYSPGKRLIITGHSLGGALATLCAPDVTAHTGFKRPWVVTFGSPKVGNPAFVAAFHRTVGDSLRVVNTSDIVPRFPPSTTSLAYRHIRRPLYIRFSAVTAVGRHKIRSYYRALAALSPVYSNRMCKMNPHFCNA
jgi:triacylglycerol lipase